MANLNAPFGFRPIRNASGLGHTTNEYTITSGLAENIAIGDLVKSNGSGGIQKAAAGDAFLGTFAGCRYQDATGKYQFKKYWASGTTCMSGTIIYALVHDDPNETFEVQTSGTVATTEIGQFVNLVDGTPDAALGVSRQTVNAGGSTESQFRIERILYKPQRTADANNNTSGYGLSTTGQYALLEVKPTKHERLGSAAGVEV